MTLLLTSSRTAPAIEAPPQGSAPRSLPSRILPAIRFENVPFRSRAAASPPAAYGKSQVCVSSRLIPRWPENWAATDGTHPAMTSITIEQARSIIANSLAHGRVQAMQPLAVLVLDAGGHPTAFEREDGASNLRFQVADGKAYGALGLGIGSRALFNRAQEQPSFVTAVNGAFGGRLVPVPGGVLVRDASGSIIGAVGVSGDNSDNDEAAAVAGIQATGLVADTG